MKRRCLAILFLILTVAGSLYLHEREARKRFEAEKAARIKQIEQQQKMLQSPREWRKWSQWFRP